MLDMGFEKEMTQCLDLIKKRCISKYSDEKGKNYHSDQIKVNFVSATLSEKVETLGSKLMKEHVKVGFSQEGPKDKTKRKKSGGEDELRNEAAE